MNWINLYSRYYYNVDNICSVVLNGNGEVHIFLINATSPIVLKARYAEEFIRQFREIVK